MRETSHIKIHLKIRSKGGKEKSYCSSKLRRIYSIVQGAKFEKAYLRVTQGHEFNEGEYSDIAGLKMALSAFTEKN